MLKKALLIASAGMTLSLPTTVMAQADGGYIGEIITVGFNYCPIGWAEANGALLSIDENSALFALIGTTYGGDGQTTFAVPDLRGRAITHFGQGPGLPLQAFGQTSGQTSVTLTTANLPAHTHIATVRAQSAAGNSAQPTRNSMAQAPAGENIYSTADPNANMNAGDVNVQAAGTGQPIGKTSPRLTMLNCIALFGIFPSRP